MYKNRDTTPVVICWFIFYILFLYYMQQNIHKRDLLIQLLNKNIMNINYVIF